jgi:DNA-binding HxlR family transcriptional regulator
MYIPSIDKIQYFDESPTCACKVSLDYLGDKWILVIIRDLFRKRYTFSQFMYDSDEKIATNILTDRLKKLRSQNIIDFRLNNKNKKIKEYYLTDRGVELYDIIYQLQYWTLQNVNFTFSENTKKWKKLSEELPREKVIDQYKQSYKEFRKKTFGF